MDTTTPNESTAVLEWAHDAFKSHGRDYPTYRDYMHGVQPLNFATEKFKSAFGRQFATFAYNRCAMVVDAHADRLQVTGFGADNEAISQTAQNIWDENQMDVREGQVEVESFSMGDGYVIVEKDPDSGDILIWPQYADNIRVAYSDTRPGLITKAARWWVEDKHVRVNIYLPDRIEKYRSTKAQTSTTTDWSWKDLEQHQPEGEAWPVMLDITDTVPVFHFGNNAPVNGYGSSELRDVVPLQDAINKTVMDMLVAMEFAAYPQRVMIGVDVGEDATVDAIQRFQGGLDRMLVVTGSSDKPASIAEFSAAQMTQYLDVAEKFDQFIARVSRVPSRYLTQEATQVSGASKRMDESAWVSKIEDRQRAFGGVWADAMRYALRLSGTEVEPGALRVNWLSAAPLGEAEELELAMLKQSLGFPFPALLREMGYEPDQIEQLVAEKAAAADEAAAQFNRGLVAPPFADEEAA